MARSSYHRDRVVTTQAIKFITCRCQQREEQSSPIQLEMSPIEGAEDEGPLLFKSI
jgi:hypothetical protein